MSTDRTLIEVCRYRLPSRSATADFGRVLGSRLAASGVDAGLFGSSDDAQTIVVASEHDDFDSIEDFAARVTVDGEFAFESIDVSVLRSFATLPRVEQRFSGAERRYQLRIYEHPDHGAGRTKIEMFETEELAIFRRVGLNPVFFGQAIAGPALPNLTYLLGFDNADAQRQAWRTFVADPAWKELSAIPRFSDDVLIRRITNLNLEPLPGSRY